MWFNIVKRHFDRGNYTEDDVRVFVQAEMLTEDQYKEITGEDYE